VTEGVAESDEDEEIDIVGVEVSETLAEGLRLAEGETGMKVVAMMVVHVLVADSGSVNVMLLTGVPSDSRYSTQPNGTTLYRVVSKTD